MLKRFWTWWRDKDNREGAQTLTNVIKSGGALVVAAAVAVAG